jgi:hypothetical protein
MSKWHLPDGEQQRQRDDFWKSRGSPKSAGKEWDGKHVDVPPMGFTDPTLQAYFRGHKTVEFVS